MTGSSPTDITPPPPPSGSYQVGGTTSNGKGATHLPIDYNQTVITHEVERLPVSPSAHEGNGSGTPASIPMPPRRQSQRTYEQATAINLSGQFEKWGMATSKQLATAKLEFTNLTVQQLKQILDKLPRTCKAHLEVSYLEDEQS